MALRRSARACASSRVALSASTTIAETPRREQRAPLSGPHASVIIEIGPDSDDEDDTPRRRGFGSRREEALRAAVKTEAPAKKQQAWFIKHFGSNVNLGNIAPEEVISVETLRLGLRGDTLLHFH